MRDWLIHRDFPRDRANAVAPRVGHLYVLLAALASPRSPERQQDEIPAGRVEGVRARVDVARMSNYADGPSRVAVALGCQSASFAIRSCPMISFWKTGPDLSGLGDDCRQPSPGALGLGGDQDT
jgi:hypothetical protein